MKIKMGTTEKRKCGAIWHWHMLHRFNNYWTLPSPNCINFQSKMGWTLQTEGVIATGNKVVQMVSQKSMHQKPESKVAVYWKQRHNNYTVSRCLGGKVISAE